MVVLYLVIFGKLCLNLFQKNSHLGAKILISYGHNFETADHNHCGLDHIEVFMKANVVDATDYDDIGNVDDVEDDGKHDEEKEDADHAEDCNDEGAKGHCAKVETERAVKR